MTNALNKQFQKQILVEQKVLSSIRYYIRNAYIEFKRRMCYFCLAFFSVTIVVTAAAVAQSVIDRAPIIFLKAAEANKGQTDFEIVPSQSILNPGPVARESYLNLTRVNEILNDERAKYTAPRFEVEGNFVSNQYCRVVNKTIQTIYDSTQNCKLGKKGTIYFMDQEKEKEIGLGTSWKVVNLKEGEIIIHRNLQAQLGVHVGDSVYFKTSEFQDLAQNLSEQMCGPDFNTTYCTKLKNELQLEGIILSINKTAMSIPLKVASIYTQDGGKFGSQNLDSFIIADFKYLFTYVVKYLYPNNKFLKSSGSEFFQFIQNQKPEFYTTQIKLNFENKDDIYLDSNYDNIQYRVTKYASNLVNDLGVYPVDLNWPILNDLYDTRFAGMFLGIVLNLIIFVLFMLSVMLLYNLLLVSVETKTYELGVLRVLGLNKLGVISLIFIQCLSYVLPGVAIGFVLAIPLLGMVSNQLEGAIGTGMSNTPTPNAIGFGLGIGILIPLVSSIIPIKSALQQTLGFALDQQRSKSQAVKLEIDVEGKGFPWGVVTFALITSCFGISVYYLLPLALLSFDFALLISIFFWILIGLLVGCILLALNIQYLIEKLVVYTFLIWLKSAIRAIVLKNLASHRLKNRRTAIMYGLSIAFVIFVYTAMTVQIESADFQTKQSKGALMTVSSTGNYFLKTPVFEKIIKDKLDTCVTSHSWVTASLNKIMTNAGYQRNFVTHIGRIYEIYPTIVGVSPNYLQTTFSDEFSQVVESSSSGLDVVEELYTPRGSQSMLMGKTYQDILFFSTDKDSSLLNIAYNGTSSKAFEMRVNAVAKQMPGLTYSGLPSVTKQNIMISLPTFIYFVGDLIESSNDIPMTKLLLKFNPGCRQRLYDTLSQEMSQQSIPAKIWDYNETKDATEQQKQLINIIFTVICAIAMILSFFSLVSAMTANILEQTKEIAILRAVGLTTFRMKTIYFFEAFTLVFSSCVIGVMVGVSIGFTMSMQRSLFTDLPIQFSFPYLMLIVMLIASVVCAFFSTIIPTSNILKNHISQIARMTN